MESIKNEKYLTEYKLKNFHINADVIMTAGMHVTNAIFIT